MLNWQNMFLRKDSLACTEARKSLVRLFFENSFVICLLIAAITRIYFYIYPKDFWVDESMIALAIDRCSWLDIFQGKFSYYQRCPLGFAVINKILSIFTDYSRHVLYIIPTVLGIWVLFLMCKLCMIYNKSKAFVFVCIAFFSLFLFPLYYSSEFKQYIYEMFVTVALFTVFFYDLNKKYDRSLFISFKYPLLFIGGLLFSNASVFIAASLCLTMYIYILHHERGSFVKITCSFASRYIIYAVFCIAYYVLFLNSKSTLQFMYTWWSKYFIPLNISELPTFMEIYLFPMLAGLLQVGSITKFPLLVLPCFIGGGVCIYRKNRYEFLSLFFPFCIAVLAGFKFYPLGGGGDILGARLQSYLFPLIIFISSYGVYRFLCFLYKMTRVKKWVVYILTIMTIIFVFDVNIKYIKTGTYNTQQVFSLFEYIKDNYEEGDAICVESMNEPVFEYWMLINKIKFSYVYLKNYDASLEEKVEIKKKILTAYDAMPRNKKMFIVYSMFWGKPISQYYFDLFREKGCEIQVKKSIGSELHIVSKD